LGAGGDAGATITAHSSRKEFIMSRTRTRLALWTILLCLLWGLFPAKLAAKSQEGSPSEQTTSEKKEQKSKKQTVVQSDASSAATASVKKSSSKKTGQSSASAEEIAAAKSSGKVWVNLDSGVYHKSGRWYGKTKNGKFMSEDEAKQAGYRESKRQ
jgi:hypothetical protein